MAVQWGGVMVNLDGDVCGSKALPTQRTARRIPTQAKGGLEWGTRPFNGETAWVGHPPNSIVWVAGSTALRENCYLKIALGRTKAIATNAMDEQIVANEYAGVLLPSPDAATPTTIAVVTNPALA
jgi:hypothetical protein